MLAANLFKEKGYQSTTLADVAKHAGLDRATVYYYIGSKKELFREVIKDILDDNVAAADRILADKTLNPRQKLQTLLEKLMLSYERSYPHMYVYIQEEMHGVAKEATPWAKEKLFQLLNYRYSARLPTVITTSSTPEEIDPWLRTRMLDIERCQFCALEVSPFRRTRTNGAPKPRRSRK